MKQGFITEYNDNGNLVRLANADDPYGMNWVKPEAEWGEAFAPEALEIGHRFHLLDDGNLTATYTFANRGESPVYLKETDIGVVISLPDYYVDAETCMTQCCHTHIWCGGSASWIEALRMGGEAPHLGMALTAGSLRSYSIRRDESQSSNDRGSFVLHPDVARILPGEIYTLNMVWFWHMGHEDFMVKLRKLCPMVVELDQATVFGGETVTMTLHSCAAGLPEVRCDREIATSWAEVKGDAAIKTLRVTLPEDGPYRLELRQGDTYAFVHLYRSPGLEELIEARCWFICEHQQETGGPLDGAYLIYDNETGRRYYSTLHDHNGGRERVGMGALLALWLQSHPDEQLNASLDRYAGYVYRELLDRDTGEVFNDCGRNQNWDRLYNYPWMAVFLLELYRLRGDKTYLLDAWRVLHAYYDRGGAHFYAIGLPAYEVIRALEAEKETQKADALRERLIEHALWIAETGRHFPKSEVNYEQSIVAPAVSILLQGCRFSDAPRLRAAAKDLMGILRLFNGGQPDYHLYGNAIRHWDGYWFGKRRMLGDTFPHYWSVLTGVAMAEYADVTGEADLRTQARASLRGTLNLFDTDGRASCAMVYPETVNEMKAHYYDPWANDQDWALYYAWKYRALSV